jgi:hypothetical protein
MTPAGKSASRLYIDTWIVVRELEENEGKKHVRGLYIVKSRGTGHSSDVHIRVLDESKEFIQQSDGRLARYVQCDQSRQRPERVFTRPR